MMRIFILALLLLASGYVSAQQLPDMGTIKVRIADKEQVIVAGVNPTASNPKAKTDRLYYWYYANSIHSTQGGYSGKLLDGLYSVYYIDKNLKEQGNFKTGLKAGIWKTWDEAGHILQTTNWKNGVLQPEHPVPFWKKIPLIKKIGHKAVDTTQKVK